MPKSDARTDLLREGCKSYHLALFAVAQFRWKLQELFRKTLKRRATELAEATKLDKRTFTDRVQDYRNPSKDDPDGAWAEVGVQLPKKGEPWILYVYLSLADGEPASDYPTPALYAYLWLKERGVLRAKLDGLPDDMRFKGAQNAYMFQPISVDESFDLQGSLDKLLDRWMSVWREVGGIAPLLPDKDVAKSVSSK